MPDTETRCRPVAGSSIKSIVRSLLASANATLGQRPHGDQAKWNEIIRAMPRAVPSVVDFTRAIIEIGRPGDMARADKAQLARLLRDLHPWRKGPFDIFGIRINSEWRSDLKWSRLEKHISPLDHRLVLDVGCGNGYYMLRMLGAGARYVLGIDPAQLFNAQFNALKTFIPDVQASMLPLRCGELPFAAIENTGAAFNTVFSMGILYHRRDAMAHLQELWRCLKPGGELVLETLMFDGGAGEMLVPDKTYAKMPNVWCIPTEAKLHRMLNQTGFYRVRTIDISMTTVQEQRKTDWMMFESLADFLDADDHAKTIEGYPAPKRILITCTRL